MSTLTVQSAPGGRLLSSWRSLDRLHVHAVITALSFVSYVLGRLFDGGAGTVFAVGGVGACGWAWLLTRALFDAEPHDARWPRVVALIIQLSGAAAILLPNGSAAAGIAENSYVLCGSAALLLTFVEPFSRRRPGLPTSETRFRIVFLAVYTLLVAVSILGLRSAGGGQAEADRIELIKAACAFAGLWACGAAIWFRVTHPLERDSHGRTARRAATTEDLRLAERLQRLLREEELHTEPDLRIADVAARLGEPEYRVSQCIAGLGFPNFNRLINHHRIRRAKALLADPAYRGSILEIAFDCGFGSLGPFNRAFRDEVGMTPRAFRKSNEEAAGAQA